MESAQVIIYQVKLMETSLAINCQNLNLKLQITSYRWMNKRVHRMLIYPMRNSGMNNYQRLTRFRRLMRFRRLTRFRTQEGKEA
jgi:hypothetical protein